MPNFDPTFVADHTLDTQGLICPEPIMLLHKTLRNAQPNTLIYVIASDPATLRDIPNFCRHLGHTLLEESTETNPKNLAEPDPYANVYHFWLRKKN